jgi:translation initiation factor IF-3
LVDFGQFRYEQQKREKQARKSGKTQVLKELKLSPKISEHDYQVRLSSGRKFLQKGYKLKVSVFFKGREMAHPEIGQEILERYIREVEDLGSPEGKFSRAPRSMLIMINPNK